MYTLIYDEGTGKVGIIMRDDGTSFPLSEENRFFQEFLIWNAEQDPPLDLDSTIEIVPPEPKTQEVFDVPVVAPDFVVQSPKPKDDHKEAHAEAIKESKKDSKSIASIVLNQMVYIEELEKRILKLEKGN